MLAKSAAAMAPSRGPERTTAAGLKARWRLSERPPPPTRSGSPCGQRCRMNLSHGLPPQAMRWGGTPAGDDYEHNPAGIDRAQKFIRMVFCPPLWSMMSAGASLKAVLFRMMLSLLGGPPSDSPESRTMPPETGVLARLPSTVLLATTVPCAPIRAMPLPE